MNTTVAPVIALAAWSLIILAVLMVRRFGAMKAQGISLAGRRGGRGGDLDPIIGDPAKFASHNYTHLMEQPTLFYAVALALAVMGRGAGWSAWLAWAYVAVRVVHSFVQTSSNYIPARASLFFASTIVLIVLVIHAGVALTV